MHKKISYFVYLSAILITFISCSKIKPDPKVPSYIYIDKVDLSTDAVVQGSNSHQIEDVWISIDGKAIGTFELPCTVPIIADDGTHTIRVDAGVKMNGISATRNKYHFYKPYEVSVDLVKEAIITINPSFSYEPFTNFVWLEDFNSSSFTLEKTSSSDAGIILVKNTGTDVFEGSGSGQFIIGPSHTNLEFQSTTIFPLPKSGSDVILEMNYKTSLELTVGLYTSALSATYREQIITLKPSSEWKKIYISVTNVSLFHADAGGHRIFFAAKNNGSEAYVFLDNIKLIY